MRGGGGRRPAPRATGPRYRPMNGGCFWPGTATLLLGARQGWPARPPRFLPRPARRCRTLSRAGGEGRQAGGAGNHTKCPYRRERAVDPDPAQTAGVGVPQTLERGGRGPRKSPPAPPPERPPRDAPCGATGHRLLLRQLALPEPVRDSAARFPLCAGRAKSCGPAKILYPANLDRL